MKQTRDIVTASDLIALREDSEFHEGALALLTYPTAEPVGYLSHDNPKYIGGKQVTVGKRVIKGEAGDFEVETL